MKTADKTTLPATSSYTDPTTDITYSERHDIFTIGAGYLNVGNALFSTDLAPAGLSAMSPALSSWRLRMPACRSRARSRDQGD